MLSRCDPVKLTVAACRAVASSSVTRGCEIAVTTCRVGAAPPVLRPCPLPRKLLLNRGAVSARQYNSLSFRSWRDASGASKARMPWRESLRVAVRFIAIRSKMRALAIALGGWPWLNATPYKSHARCWTRLRDLSISASMRSSTRGLSRPCEAATGKDRFRRSGPD